MRFTSRIGLWNMAKSYIYFNIFSQKTQNCIYMHIMEARFRHRIKKKVNCDF